MHIFFFLVHDLSSQGFASQKPVFPGEGSYLLYEARNAIDRNTSTCMRTDAIGPTAPYKHMWWKVDLGAVYSIYSINILFKNYNSFGMYLIALKQRPCFFQHYLLHYHNDISKLQT